MARLSLDHWRPGAAVDILVAFGGFFLGVLGAWIFHQLRLPRVAFAGIDIVEIACYLGLIFGALVADFPSSNRADARSRMAMIIFGMIAALLYSRTLDLFWMNPEESYFLLGGLIPTSDAHDWVSGGWSLLETGAISEFNSRRPLNSVLFAFRLYIAGDLQGSLQIGATMSAAASLYLALVLRHSVGWSGAAIFFVCAFWAIREHLPITMTEVHGFVLGCLAIALLWRASLTGSTASFLVGLLIMTLAMSARAGPFLLLPTLLLWGVLHFNKENRLATMTLGALIIIGGFLLSSFLNWFLGNSDMTQNSNFALTLYGMAVGGAGWLQAFSDFPELLDKGFGSGRESEIASFLYIESLRQLVEDPTRFIGFYFSELGRFVVLFLKYDLHVSRIAMLIAGIWVIIRFRDRSAQLIILASLGITLSAPFLMLDAGIRAFAPVFPAFAVLPALAAGIFLRWLPENVGVQPLLTQASVFLQRPMITLCISGMLIGIVSIVILDKTNEDSGSRDDRCGDGYTLVNFNSRSSGYVNVVGDDKKHVRLPNIKRTVFFATFPASVSDHIQDRLSELPTPFGIISGWDLISNSEEVVLVEGSIEMAKGGSLPVCVSSLRHGYKKGYRIVDSTDPPSQ
jgi:hypothetical protein